MQPFYSRGICGIKNLLRTQPIQNTIVIFKHNVVKKNSLYRTIHCSTCLFNQASVPVPLRRRKRKADSDTNQHFVDMRQVRVKGGNGGDGEISFLRLWANEYAGPDGGDGGHGGHVIFEVTTAIKDLNHVLTLIQAEHGERGMSKDCFGKNANNAIVKVPGGTIVRDTEGQILADLDEEGMMFVAARGGAGGHGNKFFVTDVNQSPKVAEYGAQGEERQYVLEIRSMAHIGLIGLPNAGKSTLLRAISRARPKVAAYPFTTLKPHLGMVLYDDYEQIAVADLPGLIENSHKNRGLGIMFLKHAERCAALLFIIDITADEPWEQLYTLQNEIGQFSPSLNERPCLVIANKMDLPEAEKNLELLKQKIDLPIVPISAKVGTNVTILLRRMRMLYDENLKKNESNETTIKN